MKRRQTQSEEFDRDLTTGTASEKVSTNPKRRCAARGRIQHSEEATPRSPSKRKRSRTAARRHSSSGKKRYNVGSTHPDYSSPIEADCCTFQMLDRVGEHPGHGVDEEG